METMLSCERDLDLEQALTRRIQERTGRRVQDLDVRVTDEGVHVRGYAYSYYALQLALLAVREVVDATPVRMNIEVLAGASRRWRP